MVGWLVGGSSVIVLPPCSMGSGLGRSAALQNRRPIVCRDSDRCSKKVHLRPRHGGCCPVDPRGEHARGTAGRSPS